MYIVINFVANKYIQFISFSSLLKAVNFKILLIVPIIFYFLKNYFSLFSNCPLYSCPLLSFFLPFVLLFCFFSHIHPRKSHSLQGLQLPTIFWVFLEHHWYLNYILTSLSPVMYLEINQIKCRFQNSSSVVYIFYFNIISMTKPRGLGITCIPYSLTTAFLWPY